MTPKIIGVSYPPFWSRISLLAIIGDEQTYERMAMSNTYEAVFCCEISVQI